MPQECLHSGWLKQNVFLPHVSSQDCLTYSSLVTLCPPRVSPCIIQFCFHLKTQHHPPTPHPSYSHAEPWSSFSEKLPFFQYSAPRRLAASTSANSDIHYLNLVKPPVLSLSLLSMGQGPLNTYKQKVGSLQDSPCLLLFSHGTQFQCAYGLRFGTCCFVFLPSSYVFLVEGKVCQQLLYHDWKHTYPRRTCLCVDV